MTICTTCIERMAGEVDAVMTMSYLPFMEAEYRQKYTEALCRLRDTLNLPIFMAPSYASRAAAAKPLSATCGYQEQGFFFVSWWGKPLLSSM